MLTQDKLKSMLDYEPRTGVFRWLVSPNNRVRPGDEAGSKDSDGYIQIRILGKRYAASRLAVFWMTGEFPSADVDHRDHVPSNNRWRNLRPATTTENLRNKRVQSNNKAGLKGVTTVAPNYWRARIKFAAKATHIGVFNCPAAAHFAYLIAADVHFGAFANAS